MYVYYPKSNSTNEANSDITIARQSGVKTMAQHSTVSVLQH